MDPRQSPLIPYTRTTNPNSHVHTHFRAYSQTQPHYPPQSPPHQSYLPELHHYHHNQPQPYTSQYSMPVGGLPGYGGGGFGAYGYGQESEDKNESNPFVLIERALRNNSQALNGFLTKDPPTNAPPETQTTVQPADKLSMEQILKKIEQQCEPNNEEGPSMEASKNPIYSKINKYAEKLNKSRSGPMEAEKSKDKEDVRDSPSVVIMSMDGRKLADQPAFNSGAGRIQNPQPVTNSNTNSKSSNAFLQVESKYEMKKIHTDESEQCKAETAGLLQGSKGPLVSSASPISPATSNAHKNIRNKIIASSIHHPSKIDFGVQVNMSPLPTAVSALPIPPSSNQLRVEPKLEVSNLKEYSELSEEERERNGFLHSFKDSQDVVIKLEESIYESMSANRRRAKTTINKSTKPSSRLLQSQTRAKTQKNRQKLPLLQSIQSIDNIQDSINTTPNTNTKEKPQAGEDSKEELQARLKSEHGPEQIEEEEEEGQMDQSYAESDVMEQRETIKYQNVGFKKEKGEGREGELMIPSLAKEERVSNEPASSMKFNFTESKDESLQFSKNRITRRPPTLPPQSPTLPPSLTASKISNIISSFSQLRQIINFEFSQFKVYMGEWVRQLREGYENLLMEKEESIFVLQLQKISLEDQLRDAAERKVQGQQGEGARGKDQETRQTRERPKKDKLGHDKVWKELNEVEEVLSAQVYKIEAERDREFDQIVQSHQHS